ncbi:MAG: RIP metalloprotease RseP [Candidatus Omnitrophica bacterium]|nr:RIP metalloprotease RseP [Candidatus Omnitrophota bacterium]
MISILAFIFVFGILIFVHEFGHFILAKKNGVRVEKFSFGFGPRLWGRKIGATEYLISAVPLGGYIRMAGDEPGKARKGAPWEYLSKTCGQRAQIVAFGPILNYLLAFLLFSFVFIVGAPTPTTKVGEVLADYPAGEAGIRKDDVILTVAAEKVEYWQDMAQIIHRKTEGQVVLDIKRGERVFKIKIRPKIEESKDIFGQKTKIALIGISPSDETTTIKYGWGKSFYKGGEKLLTLSGFTCKALWFILTRRLSLRESVTGPVGIFYFTGRAAELGFIYLLNLMGLLSMSLAIFNFLPLPVLDGGHLFFLLLEKFRKRPVSVRAQEVATQAGMMLLFALMIFVIYNDLVRFGVWGKASEWWNRLGPK